MTVSIMCVFLNISHPLAVLVRTSHAAEKEFYIGLTRNFTGHWTWFDQSAVNYTVSQRLSLN